MDPKANLAEQIQIALAMLGDDDLDNDRDWWKHSAPRLAELVIALDGWMRKGGFSPWGNR